LRLALVAGGEMTGASITALSCATTLCTVTVSIADGDGTLGLDVVDTTRLSTPCPFEPGFEVEERYPPDAAFGSAVRNALHHITRHVTIDA